MNLECFMNNNLFDATEELFSQLGINLHTNTKQVLGAEDILKDKCRDRSQFKDIKKIYYSGVIEDSFDNAVTDDGDRYENAIKIANKKYDGLMLFSMELNKKPNRSRIAELTRTFNQISQKMPVGLVLKYNKDDHTHISIALSERFKYLQDWRHGEKVGKVIILRDINTEKPHAGHLRILEDLAKHNAKNFNELHKAWLKVLNIKTLNDTFYKRLVEWYKLCFDDIKINLNVASKILGKDIDNELKPQAVIRVIIRLLFIWFMKEKELIKKDFFRREFAVEFLKNKNTYYNAILQNLFFAVLNKKIKERRFRYKDNTNYYDPEKNDYGIFDVFRFEDDFNPGKAGEFLKLANSIPFVNGGLFTCHDYVFSGKDSITNEKNSKFNYHIDGFSEKKNVRAKISDNVIFELIDLFSDFVFTIEESTPYEQDIALDPELLGIIFENLIGFYNPETKENARKLTGSFYTPREIVEYMCCECLKESLKSKFPTLDSQIDDLIDNDVDSGISFPQKKKIESTITDLKILDPACGSGAFPMGMFNLMVRVVEKLDNHKTTYENKLDIIKNCIYGVDIQNIAIEISKLRFFISLLVDCPMPENIENFDVLPNLETKFIVANTLIGINLEGSSDMFVEFLREEFENLTGIFLLFTTAKTPKEKGKIKNDFNNKKEVILNDSRFEASTDVKEKIRAWNPFNVCYCSPFFDSGIMFGLTQGFDIVIGNPPYVQLQKDDGKLANLYQDCGYKTFARTGDIYCLFYERGWQLLKPRGRLCFITSNKWMRAGYGENTRKFFAENTNSEQLIDFAGVKVFESATVDTNILMFAKDKNRQKTQACIVKKEGIEDLSVFVRQNAAACTFGEDSWVVLSPIEQRIKTKIEAVGTPLKDWDINIYRGILTGYNEAFIINGDKKKELIEQDPKSAEIIRPILRGRDIKRYGYNFADLWLINTHNGIKEKGIKPINVNNYPAIKKHLDNYWDKIEHRADQGDTPYNLRNCAYIEDFSKQKIVYPETTLGAFFAIDEEKMFIDKTCFMLISKNIKYIQAMLSSKLFEFAYKTIFSSIELGTDGYQYNKHALIKLPVILPNKKMEQQIENLLQEKNYAAIDCLVYEIYRLDKEEIEFIKNF